VLEDKPGDPLHISLHADTEEMADVARAMDEANLAPVGHLLRAARPVLAQRARNPEGLGRELRQMV